MSKVSKSNPKFNSKKVLSLIWNNKKRSALIILADLLFYLVFFMISPMLLSYVSPNKELFSTLSFIGMSWLIVLVVFIFFLFTYFSLVLVYSFCKYLVLGQLEAMVSGKSMGFSSLLKFYQSNMLLPAAILLVLSLLLPVLRDVPNINILGAFWLLFLSILFLFLYFMLNARHSLFCADKKYSFSAIINELSTFKKYKSLAMADIISSASFFLVFGLIGYSIQYAVKTFKIGANIYDIYNPAFTLFFGIFLYSIFFFNRAYFYYATREKK